MTHKNTWADLERTLGGGAISRTADSLEKYRTEDGSLPDAIASIDRLASLEAAVNWARRHKVALYAASSQAPHHDALLRPVKGGLILDLSPMDKIIKINRKNRMALVEAGVTFETLIPQLKVNGLRALLPLRPRRGKSVLASYLDREPSIYPRYQWDISDPLLCIETVLGTGDRFTTGSAAGPGNIQQQWAAGDYQKSPMGPGQNDWMRLIQGGQGSIGVATWCSAKCELQPKKETLLVFALTDIAPLIDVSYEMFHQKSTDIHFLVDGNAMAALVSSSQEHYMSLLGEVEPWYLVVSVTGLEHFPEKRVAYLHKSVQAVTKSLGIRQVNVPRLSDVELLDRLIGPTTHNISWRDMPAGLHKSIYFQTTLDCVPDFLSKFVRIAKKIGIDTKGFATYIQPLLGGRSCHLEFVLAVPSTAQLEQTTALCDRAVKDLIRHGAFFSRPHGNWAGPAMAASHSAASIFARMKDVFDPDGIMAPGRLVSEGETNA